MTIALVQLLAGVLFVYVLVDEARAWRRRARR